MTEIRYAEETSYYVQAPCRSLNGLFAPEVPAHLRAPLARPRKLPTAPPNESAPLALHSQSRTNMPHEARAIASAGRKMNMPTMAAGIQLRTTQKAGPRTDDYRKYQREYQQKRLAALKPKRTKRKTISRRDPATCNHLYDSKPCWNKDGKVKGKQRYHCAACKTTKAYLVDGQFVVVQTRAMREQQERAA